MSGDKYLLTKQWNEAEFLAELEKRSGATARKVAEGLLQWITPEVTDVAWGLGQQPPGVVPFIQHGKEKHFIRRMATEDNFVFRFDYLSANPPFSNELLMGQLRDKINEIPGVLFPDDVRARIPYKMLTTFDALKKLKSAVAFVIEQVKDRVRISQEGGQCPPYSLHKQEFGPLSVDERVDNP